METNSHEHKLFKINQNVIIKNNDDKILILKRSGGWMLPGGRLENDKTYLDGLKREVKEETGIVDITVEKIIDVDLSDSGETYLVYFLCKTNSANDVVLSSEHSEYAWVSSATLDEYQFEYQKIKEIVKKCF